MANNKAIIRDIPLKAEMCLNKVKTDINDFSGWNNINCPVYGKTLSPLWKKNTERHDIYLNNNQYNIVVENGVEKLVQNNRTLATYELRKYTKTEISQADIQNVLDMDGSNMLYTVNDYTIGFRGKTYANPSFLSSVRCGKIISNTEVIVWARNAIGMEMIVYFKYLADVDDLYAVTYTNISFGSQVYDGWIQYYNGIVSLITDKGSDLTDINWKTYVLQGNQFHPATLQIPAGSITDTYTKVNNIDIKIQVSISRTSESEATLGTYVELSKPYYEDIKVRFYYGNATNSYEETTIYGLKNWPGTGKSDLAHGETYSTTVQGAYFSRVEIITKSAPPIYNNNGERVRDITSSDRTNKTYYDTTQYSIDVSNLINWSWDASVNGSYSKGSKTIKTTFYTWEEKTYTGTTYQNQPSVVLDDGTALFLGTIDSLSKTSQGDMMNLLTGDVFLTGTVTSIEADYTVHISPVKYVRHSKDSSDTIRPVYFVDRKITILPNFYRLYMNFIANESDRKNLPILCESEIGNYLVVHYGQSVGGYYNTSSDGEGWRILYTNDNISAISDTKSPTNIGTLLTEWNTVIDVLDYNSNRIVYKDANGRIWEITKGSTTALPYNIVANRYIVFNTTSYENAWDTLKNKAVHYASDWNNRVTLGGRVNGTLGYSSETQRVLESSIEPVLVWGTAINPNYEYTNDYLTSYYQGASVARNVIPNLVLLAQYGIEDIQTYLGFGTTSAEYYDTNRNGIRFADSSLDGAIMPDLNGTVYYSPNIFSEYIQTFNNRDMILSDGVAYPVAYTNGHPVLAYTLTSGWEGLEDVFVIQTQYYGIGNKKIFALKYYNNVLQSSDVILDIGNCQYLGALPTEALFYCKTNRTIYSFTGDAILHELWQCDDISEINYVKYRPSTQELFLNTNIGIIVVSNSYMYKLTESPDYTIDFNVDSDGNELLVLSTDSTSTAISYEQLSGFTTDGLSLTTKFYGDITNRLSTFDCIYLRLADNDEEEKSIGYTVTTLTDKGTETEYVSLDLTDDLYDAITESYYVRIQPKYQKAVAVSLSLDCSVPIVSMQFGYIPEPNNAVQVGHINL